MDINNLIKMVGDFPPVYREDWSKYRNCYAHALNCWYEDRGYDLYTPGCITAAFNDSDMYHGEDYFFNEKSFIKGIITDCKCLGIKAITCSYGEIIPENAYKIAATYSRKENDFHFIRQNADGRWSHKEGFFNFFNRRFIYTSIIEYNGEKIICDNFKVIEIFYLQKF